MSNLKVARMDRGPERYTDRFGCSMMDFYITDSLQDMLDIDIKSEMATDLGSSVDFTDTLGVSFSDLPPLLDIEMDHGSTWITGSNSSLHSSSNFVQNLDLYGSEANAVMVNPNSVMPSMFSNSPVKKSPSGRDTPNIMLNSASSEAGSRSPSPPRFDEQKRIKLEDDDDSVASFFDEEEEESVPDSKYIFVKKDETEDKKVEEIKETSTVPTSTSNTISFSSNGIKLNKAITNGRNCSILSSNQSLNGAQYIKTTTTTPSGGQKTIISGNIQILGHQQSRALLAANSNRNSTTTILIDNGMLNNNNRHILKHANIATLNGTTNGVTEQSSTTTKFISNNNNTKQLPPCAEFPKPAYSYSCLIAMALKNSRAGSLPVAEIYNFMCQHFPYFKTAPNGWKNSVRHNLSLNKCFEKIEKPSTNGGQRKGCLWAMNPSKVGKMDEEVQKWSRKDPQAIRKAMVRPDNLEALERGEMKFSGEGGGEDYCSDEEELDVDEAYIVSSTSPRTESPAVVQQYDDETSDVEVMEGVELYDEDRKPLMLEFSLSSQFADNAAKRPKTNFIYQTVVGSPSHVQRRKAPLVNRIA